MALGSIDKFYAGLLFQDRKSTRLNSSHLGISYAVFCLKKKMRTYGPDPRKRREGKKVGARFRAKILEPQRYTHYRYARGEIIKQAAAARKSLGPPQLPE